MTQSVDLITPTTILASAHTIVAGEAIHVLTTPAFENDTGENFDSIRVDVEFSNLVPNIVGSPYELGVVLLAKNAQDVFKPIHYTFSPIRAGGTALARQLVLQPDMDTFNVGIDDIFFVAGDELVRVSREQGKLPQTEYQLCIILKDNDPMGANAFVSVDVEATAELYNAVA